MHIKALTLYSILTFCLLSPTLWAEDLLSESQLKTLYEDTTVEGHLLSEKSDIKFLREYQSTGEVKEIKPNAGRLGHWRINELGQHCLKWEESAQEHCAFVQKDEKGVRKFQWRVGKKKKFIIEYNGFRDQDGRDLLETLR